MKNSNRIEIAFGNKIVGTKKLKYFVISVLKKMPEDIADYISLNCWFIGSLPDAWAFTFTGDDLKSKHMIFLSDELMSQNPGQIRYTIAHEVGHVILKHRNSVFERQTKREIAIQEREADEFALNYLS